jgi:membrane protein implicated in regulation of membrane protease activity
MALVNAWVWWLAAAGALGIPLVITAMPEFGMFAVGAVAGSLTAALGAGAVLQVVVFLAVSIALVAVVRTVAAARPARPELRTNVDALKGRQALVLERVDRHTGRVKLGGEVWSARTLDESLVFEAGQQVDVVEIEGATAVVM